MTRSSSNSLSLSKYSGAGNTFIFLQLLQGAALLPKAKIASLCEKHSVDGLVIVLPSFEQDFEMAYYNADGSKAAMCGNAARCLKRYLHSLGYKDERYRIVSQGIPFLIENAPNEQVSLHFAVTSSVTGPFYIPPLKYPLFSANTGVPHTASFHEDLTKIDLESLGNFLCHHAHFSPEKTNVNIIQKVSPQKLKIRTFERGVDNETLACGTGALASALIARQEEQIFFPLSIDVASGETLTVSLSQEAIPKRENEEIFSLTGPAKKLW